MGFTQDFLTGRRNTDDGTSRIGQLDRLWYSSTDNTIRIGDGVTPGGILVGGGGGVINISFPPQANHAGEFLQTDGTNVKWASVPLTYTLPVATDTVLGGVKVGTGLVVTNDGILSAPYTYTLPVATDTVLGGIKVGSGLEITNDGILSAVAGTQFGNIDGGGPTSVYGGIPNLDGGIG